MTDHTITVSDGEDFFRIPVSDLQAACADGFYVPALQSRTIVSNGEDLFEIPVEDLAEAEADGFRDLLADELQVLAQAKNLLNAEHSETAQSTEFAFDEPPRTSETVAQAGERVDTLSPADTMIMAPPANTDTTPRTPDRKRRRAQKHEQTAQTDAEVEENENEKDEEQKKGIARFLLAGDKSTWQVMAMNVALHGVILLVLALIILPAPEFEVFMEITSAFEPKDPVKMEFEAVELEQPQKLETDPAEMEVFNQVDIESETDVEIDVSDVELSIPDQVVETNTRTGPQTTHSKSEMGGRSKAGRASLVAKRGGSAASETAVTQGLIWLAQHQYPDGGWSYDHNQGECNSQCTQAGSLSADCRNAATGMALLAMMGAGHTPFGGDFQEEVQRGVTFLLMNSTHVPAGLDLRGEHASNTGMYTQAIAATSLCEVLAMTKHELLEGRDDREGRATNGKRKLLIKKLAPAAQASINFIVNAQHKQNGSWGYNPGASGDTSILGWQIMALKSAVHAGMSVPPSSVQGANLYLNSVQTEDGWYGYRGPEKKPSTTAIGLISRMLSGMSRSHPILKSGVAHLSARGPDKGNMYYNYYATQVMMHYGGDYWTKWNAVMRDHLVNTQIKEGHAAGSWNLADTHGARGGRVYMTCLCTMTLEVYYRHLPLYGEPKELKADITTTSD